MEEVVVLAVLGWISYKILSKVLRVLLFFFIVVAIVYFYHHGLYNINFKTLGVDISGVKMSVVKNMGEIKISSILNFFKKF